MRLHVDASSSKANALSLQAEPLFKRRMAGEFDFASST
jgi:hypothetical protein